MPLTSLISHLTVMKPKEICALENEVCNQNYLRLRGRLWQRKAEVLTKSLVYCQQEAAGNISSCCFHVPILHFTIDFEQFLKASHVTWPISSVCSPFLREDQHEQLSSLGYIIFEGLL